jgi:poly(A) polymerase
MISLEKITINNLIKNLLQEDLPEFYELRNTIENFTPWHTKESAFDHTLLVLEELEKLFQQASAEILDYLDQKLNGGYKRKQLLYIATVLHDIGKPETLTTEGEKAYCPGHEEKGTEKAKTILSRFYLSQEEKTHILNIIRYHGVFSVESTEKDPKLRFEDLKKQHPSIFLDLVLLEIADTLGCQVNSEGKQEQEWMISFYQEQISHFFNNVNPI